jgi:LacI family transcriptional regulator
MPPHHVIAVIQWADMACYRELLRGINGFANATASWQVHFFTPTDDWLAFVRREKPDGLLLGHMGNERGKQAIELCQRCVGTCGFVLAGLDQITTFESDDERVGEVAAQHFIRKGYTEFAFVGNSVVWSLARARGFERELHKAGFNFAQLQQEWEPPTAGRGWHSTDRLGQLLDWLRGLKRPLALMVHNDLRARAIAQICRDEGIRVPDDIAILGVDNDDLDCELSDPPISSVAIPWRRMGYEAATLLDRMLGGQQFEPSVITLPPIGVVERQSTDSVAVSDPDVAAAVRYIREHAHERTSVDDILKEVPIGRRSLEKRFRASLSRTPLEEIRRVHVERAKLLLATTDLSINDVARHSGFGHSTWFSEAFHDQVGQSPAQYRKQFQRG